MTASSNKRSDALADITVKQVQHLLRTVSRLTMRQRQLVEARYSEQALSFSATLEFLQEITWIREELNELSLTENGEAASRSIDELGVMRTKLIQSMIDPTSPYRAILAKYLIQFKPLDGELLYRPRLADRLQESSIRNFLMDLGVVTYRSTDDSYVLEGEGLELYVWATVEKSSSRRRFRAAAANREELGFRAEVAVVQFEKSRVGTQWASRVEHISARKPFACYDIRSVSIQDGKIVDRFIEVKAEPVSSHRFFWSASELEAARVLRDSYFLYLLPTLGAEFDFGRLLIIQDPITAVYENHEDWEIEENVILCTQRQ